MKGRPSPVFGDGNRLMGAVVITGGSRGIGAATAVLAAQYGWDVSLGYRADAQAAAVVAAECRKHGVSAVTVPVDVSREADVVRLFETTHHELGPITALVNNAGIVAGRSTVADLDAARIERLLAVNVLGAFLCAREAVRRMAVSRGGAGGSIVNVSSRAAVLGSAGEYVDYAASKAAVEAMTTGLALEVAADGIRVNAVRPGLIDTEIHAGGGQPDRVERLSGSVPMRRGGRADEVAEAIVWLMSPLASYTTGAFLDVSGGR